ncbi:MAG TPA: response regulator transcription factor [Mycobacteriales bacterium]|nr:response regulator transcription factor [Mycobacteriales bacterium]
MNALKTRQRVVLVDDHTAFVDLLRFAFDGLDDLECVGTAHSLAEAEAVVAAEEPDIVMVDLMLGEDDGLELVSRLRETRPDVVIVVASARSDASTLASVAAAGGNGFAPKRGAFAELVTILRSARPGTMTVASSLQPTVAPPITQRMSVRLTDRESQVLTLMGRGTAVAAIAEQLNVSVSTCRTYVRGVHSKLGARTQLEAVLKARAIGLLGPAEHP